MQTDQTQPIIDPLLCPGCKRYLCKCSTLGGGSDSSKTEDDELLKAQLKLSLSIAWWQVGFAAADTPDVSAPYAIIGLFSFFKAPTLLVSENRLQDPTDTDSYGLDATVR